MPGNGVAGASYGDLLMTSLLVLGGVCVAAFLIVRLLGRFLATGRTRGAHLLDVVARLPLEPRRSLYVVEVAGKTLLVGTSEMGLSVLSELDAGEVRARVVARPSFGELVRSAWLRRRGEPAVVEPASGSARAPLDPSAAFEPRGVADGRTGGGGRDGGGSDVNDARPAVPSASDSRAARAVDARDGDARHGDARDGASVSAPIDEAR